MGSGSVIHWLIVLAVVVIIFGGRGKIASIMSDIASGIKAFRKGLDSNNDDVDLNSDNSSKKTKDTE